MGVLTEDQLEQVWEEQGLKYRVRRLHKFLVDRGLLPMSVPADIFSDHIHRDLLHTFFVRGVKELPDGQQRTVSDRASQDASPSGQAPAETNGAPGAETGHER